MSRTHSTLRELYFTELRYILCNRAFLYGLILFGIAQLTIFFHKELLFGYMMWTFGFSYLLLCTSSIRLLQHSKQENMELIHLSGIKPSDYVLGNMLAFFTMILVINIASIPFCLAGYAIRVSTLSIKVIPYFSTFLLVIPAYQIMTVFTSIPNKYIRATLTFFWIPLSLFGLFTWLTDAFYRMRYFKYPITAEAITITLFSFVFINYILYQVNQALISKFDLRPTIKLKIASVLFIITLLLFNWTGLTKFNIQDEYYLRLSLSVIWALGILNIRNKYHFKPKLFQNDLCNQITLSVFGNTVSSYRWWYILILFVSLFSNSSDDPGSYHRLYLAVFLTFPSISALLESIAQNTKIKMGKARFINANCALTTILLSVSYGLYGYASASGKSLSSFHPALLVTLGLLYGSSLFIGGFYLISKEKYLALIGRIETRRKLK